MTWSLAQLIQRFNAKVLNEPSCNVFHCLCTLAKGKKGGISFFNNPKYHKLLYQTEASAILVKKNFVPNWPIASTLLGVDDPYGCFCILLQEICKQVPKCGVEKPCYLGKQVVIGDNVYRGAFSYIGDYVKIGKNVQIYPHVYVGDRVTIGHDTVIYSGAKVFAHTVIGQRCVIHAGAVVGSSGFGFLVEGDKYKRIGSTGYVVLEDDVEIGANSTIDAATVDKTVIGQGTKIDNLVHIAHNVQIGKHTAIAAQTGIAGSTKVGNYCRFGGQTGIVGHIELGDHVTAFTRAGITRSFKQGHITLSGTPAFEHKTFLSCYARFKKLHKQDTATLNYKVNE